MFLFRYFEKIKWHPGNGSHQLSSRFIVYNVIKLIRQALLDWSKMENYALPDEEWHTTAENERIRTLGLNMTGHCVELELPDRACNLPMNGRSEYTPRANPAATSIRSILRPDVEVNDPPPNFYDPPDVYNPAFDPPDDKDVDYVAIIENGNDFLPMTARHEYLLTQIRPPKVERHAPRSNLPAGKGWFYSGVAAADNCDGSYSSFCNRGADKDCLLYAHNDGRGGLYGDGLSGWILMTLSDMQHGLIIVALNEGGAHTNTKTLGWKCENNEANCKNPISDEESNSSEKTPKNQEPCKDYTVEFSVNGKVTTLPSETFKEQIQTIERTVDLSVVLNDENFVPEGQSQDVEFGIRMGGSCGRSNTLKFSFVYWA